MPNRSSNVQRNSHDLIHSHKLKSNQPEDEHHSIDLLHWELYHPYAARTTETNKLCYKYICNFNCVKFELTIC